MDYQWCHGPSCHKHHTQDRIRGVKGSKVLRTRKIAQTKWNENNVWSVFCSHGCWNDFMHEHWSEFMALHPRTEALETPIEVTKETYSNHWGTHVRTNIKEVDNNSNP